MRASMRIVLVVVLAAAFPAAQLPTAKTLNIYVMDVEGGNATLFVAPSGESVLIDTGNGGAAAARDADRIMAAVKDAGLKHIDTLITTHWHGDHFRRHRRARLHGYRFADYIDHGPNVQPAARPPTNFCRTSTRRSTARPSTRL